MTCETSDRHVFAAPGGPAGHEDPRRGHAETPAENPHEFLVRRPVDGWRCDPDLHGVTVWAHDLADAGARHHMHDDVAHP
jgi:hypothetical protein